MSRNVSLWMPAVYVYVACCRLYYFYMSLIYGEYLVNVYFSNIPHSFIPHFTLHSAEKNPHWIFRKLPLDIFPHSAKWVRSLSVHDSFGTKEWTVSVHDDFSTYEINFGTCVFCSTTSVHTKYHFGKSISVHCKLSFYAEGLQMLNGCLVCYVKLLNVQLYILFLGRHQTLILITAGRS